MLWAERNLLMNIEIDEWDMYHIRTWYESAKKLISDINFISAEREYDGINALNHALLCKVKANGTLLKVEPTIEYKGEKKESVLET